jgi:hypothetical protein
MAAPEAIRPSDVEQSLITAVASAAPIGRLFEPVAVIDAVAAVGTAAAPQLLTPVVRILTKPHVCVIQFPSARRIQTKLTRHRLLNLPVANIPPSNLRRASALPAVTRAARCLPTITPYNHTSQSRFGPVVGHDVCNHLPTNAPIYCSVCSRTATTGPSER